MIHKQEIEALIRGHGITDYRWIGTEQIAVAQWVRFKCVYGCNSYGLKGTCPPNVPTIAECREFFSEYAEGLVFHFEKKLKRPEDRSHWGRDVNLKLLDVERDIFLKGYRKAFLLFMDECCICGDCPGNRVECRVKNKSRPCPEALGVDVFRTVRNIGYEIEVLKDYADTMNRYAFLMVD